MHSKPLIHTDMQHIPSHVAVTQTEPHCFLQAMVCITLEESSRHCRIKAQATKASHIKQNSQTVRMCMLLHAYCLPTVYHWGAVPTLASCNGATATAPQCRDGAAATAGKHPQTDRGHLLTAWPQPLYASCCVGCRGILTACQD